MLIAYLTAIFFWQSLFLNFIPYRHIKLSWQKVKHSFTFSYLWTTTTKKKNDLGSNLDTFWGPLNPKITWSVVCVICTISHTNYWVSVISLIPKQIAEWAPNLPFYIFITWRCYLIRFMNIQFRGTQKKF